MAREPSSTFDAQGFAQRMADQSARRDEMLLQELRGLGETLELIAGRVDGLQADVRRHGISQTEFTARLNEFEIQIGEARDLVHKTRAEISSHISTETEAAAKGAAMGAASANIGPVVKDAFAKAGGKVTKPQLLVIFMVSAVWLTTFVEKAPAVFRAINAFFIGVMGLDRSPPT